MIKDLSRRSFLACAGSAASAVWLSAHWPALLSAAGYARQAVKSSPPPKFQFFTPKEAVEIDAVAARIIPSDETPGAREAGVIYFIDRGLATFAVDDQKTYREGLPALQSRVRELFPAVEEFSKATPVQQDQILHSLDDRTGEINFGTNAVTKAFFETVRVHTTVGFLIDPDSGGNRDGVGWKVIGHEPQHIFQPPFGYYDKDYAG